LSRQIQLVDDLQTEVMLTIESNLLTIRLDFLFVCTCLRREQRTEYLNTIDLSPLYLLYTSPLTIVCSYSHSPIQPYLQYG